MTKSPTTPIREKRVKAWAVYDEKSDTVRAFTRQYIAQTTAELFGTKEIPCTIILPLPVGGKKK